VQLTRCVYYTYIRSRVDVKSRAVVMWRGVVGGEREPEEQSACPNPKSRLNRRRRRVFFVYICIHIIYCRAATKRFINQDTISGCSIGVKRHRHPRVKGPTTVVVETTREFFPPPTTTTAWRSSGHHLGGRKSESRTLLGTIYVYIRRRR